MMRYAMYGILVIVALLGVRLYFAQAEIHSLELAIETAKVEAERQYTSQLRAQQVAYSEAIKTERAAQIASRRYYESTIAKAQQEKDHANVAARSLIVVINGLLDRLTARFGATRPADSGGIASRGSTADQAGSAASHEYTDIATALDDTVTWCEQHVGQLQAIGELQRAALQVPR